jgi:hypothetical protein
LRGLSQHQQPPAEDRQKHQARNQHDVEGGQGTRRVRRRGRALRPCGPVSGIIALSWVNLGQMQRGLKGFHQWSIPSEVPSKRIVEIILLPIEKGLIVLRFCIEPVFHSWCSACRLNRRVFLRIR